MSGQSGGPQSWGFLSRTLANVESRLDKVLDNQTREVHSPVLAEKKVPASRPSVQDRLAAAVSGRDSPSSVVNEDASQSRQSEDNVKSPVLEYRNQSDDDSRKKEPAEANVFEPDPTISAEENLEKLENLERAGTALLQINTLEEHTEPIPVVQSVDEAPIVVSELEEPPEVRQLRSDLLVCEQRREEEGRAYRERIDALEGKVKFLAREAAEASRRSAGNSTGLEKQLAERDERIALLMEEGEGLSKAELKQMNSIKRLRAKQQDTENSLADMSRRLEKATIEALEVKEKFQKAIEAEKKQSVRIKTLSKFEAEVHENSRELAKAKEEIESLKDQLVAQVQNANAAALEEVQSRLDDQTVATNSLQAELAAVTNASEQDKLQLQRALSEANARQARDLQRAEAAKADLHAEITALESKVETWRARAEEMSSGASSNAHAKLLRQVETLQSQHSMASQNWQRIETSLQQRVHALEKERDDLHELAKESRRSARELRTEKELLESERHNLSSKINDLQAAERDMRVEVEDLRKQLAETNSQLSRNEQIFSAEKKEWESSVNETIERQLHSRLEMERARLEQEQFVASPISRRSEFRRTSRQASFGDALAQFANHGQNPSKTSITEVPEPMVDAFNISTPRSLSRVSLAELEESQEAQISQTLHSRGQTPMEEVSISANNVAGPNVQMMERMSASVRLLESQMAGAKEELRRIATQRDEARAEVLELVREVEQKRQWETVSAERSKELEALNGRYQTTLELLGEKSEMVEELRADVQDVKQMYKDLVERVAQS